MSGDLQFMLGVAAIIFAYFAGQALCIWAGRRVRANKQGEAD